MCINRDPHAWGSSQLRRSLLDLRLSRHVMRISLPVQIYFGKAFNNNNNVCMRACVRLARVRVPPAAPSMRSAALIPDVSDAAPPCAIHAATPCACVSLCSVPPPPAAHTLPPECSSLLIVVVPHGPSGPER